VNSKEEIKKESNLLLDIVESFISSFVVLMVLYVFLAFPEIVSGASMEPILRNGERILVERISKHLAGIERGDIIIFHPPGQDSVDYVKRVIGVPGDVVKVSACKVYVTTEDGRFELEEPYLYEGTCTEAGPSLKEGRAQKVEEGEYIVLGDNRTKSADSRMFGPIIFDRVVGKAALRFWPPSEIQIF
jgi:signal peptidase I